MANETSRLLSLLLSADVPALRVSEIIRQAEADGLHVDHLAGPRHVLDISGPTDLCHAGRFQDMTSVERVIEPRNGLRFASLDLFPQRSQVRVGDAVFGGEALTLVAGPCAVESREQILTVAGFVAGAGAQLLRGGAYKPRTSPYSFQGLATDGLQLLAKAKEESGLPLVSEVKDPRQLGHVLEFVDMVQIGTRSMQNFALLEEVGKCGVPVLLKRGMGNTVMEWLLAAEYIMFHGNPNVVLCERGIRTFESATRFTFDINAIPIAKQLTHLPIIADPSHAVGRRDAVAAVAKAAIAAGADGLIIEVHPQPDQAMSDGDQSLTFPQFDQLCYDLSRLAPAIDRQWLPAFRDRSPVRPPHVSES